MRREGTIIMEAAITDCKPAVLPIEPYPGAASLWKQPSLIASQLFCRLSHILVHHIIMETAVTASNINVS